MSDIKESFYNKLDEMRKETLGSYIKQASHKNMYKSVSGTSSDAGEGDPRAIKTYKKRTKGIETAVSKLTGQAKVPAKD